MSALSVFKIYRKTPRFTNSILVFGSGARVGGLKRENNVEQKRIPVVWSVADCFQQKS